MIAADFSKGRVGLIDRYRDRLPVAPDTQAVSLCEGSTPLIPVRRLLDGTGKSVELYVKFEGMNPTGSFKDRGMTMAVTQAKADGAKAIVCASTGNTSASAAAYATRAEMACFVLIPEGNVALGKLAQAMMHGAHVLQISGNFDDGLDIVRQLGRDTPLAVVNSVNPYRLQGQKTIAFEVTEELGRAPDYHCLPVGNAGNISAHWIGYCEQCPARSQGNRLTAACNLCDGACRFERPGASATRPRLLGYQASGAAPFLRGAPVASPETVATAIRIGNPASMELANAASSESGGWFDEFDDADILSMQRRLASEEGVFCEPASAISVAGALRDIERGRIEEGSTVVCTVTGHGLKDPSIAIEQAGDGVVSVPATFDAVAGVVRERLD